MEKFESQEYRDQLAVNLNSTRENEGRDAAKEILSKERESILYKVSELLSKVKNILPLEYESYLSSFRNNEDSEDTVKNFDITDVSTYLTLEHRLFIEAEILEDFTYHAYGYDIPQDVRDYLLEIKSLLFGKKDSSWGIESGPGLLNEITSGDFYDNINFNHVVVGQKSSPAVKSFLIRPFNLESVMMVDELESLRVAKILFLEAGQNLYAAQISKPLVILKPNDACTRKFIEESHPFENMDQLVESLRQHGDGFTTQLQRNENGVVGYSTSNHDSDMYRLLFLAGYPVLSVPNIGTAIDYSRKSEKVIPEYKWSDVVSEMVNLRTRKLYKRKQTVDEEAEVSKSIEHYRDLLRDKFDIDYERDKERRITDLK